MNSMPEPSVTGVASVSHGDVVRLAAVIASIDVDAIQTIHRRTLIRLPDDGDMALDEAHTGIEVIHGTPGNSYSSFTPTDHDEQ